MLIGVVMKSQFEREIGSGDKCPDLAAVDPRE
jgi:hypothetical protein